MKPGVTTGSGCLLISFSVFLLPAAVRAQPQNLSARIDSIAAEHFPICRVDWMDIKAALPW